MIIKYRYLELVKEKDDKPHQIPLEFIDDYEPIDTSISLYDEDEPFDVDRVYLKLQQRRKKLIADVKKINNDNSRKVHSVHAEQLIQTLDKCIEYLLRFQNFDAYNVADYVINNSTIEKTTLGNYFLELFGKSIYADNTKKTYNTN